MMVGEPADSFRPKPSLGWLWALVLAAVMVVPLGAALITEPIPAEGRVIVYGTFGMVLVIALWFLAAVVFFGRMRYDLGTDALVITYGPILRYRVRYTDITDVRVADLRFSPWSSFRFPGLALWKVSYGGGMGTVKMCSTRSQRGVLLITAGVQRYGISPAEEERFMHELGVHRERASRAPGR